MFHPATLLTTATLCFLVLIFSNYHVMKSCFSTWKFSTAFWVTTLFISISFLQLLFRVLRNLTTWPAENVKVKPFRAKQFHPEDIPRNIDTIVIGSGSEGCACASLLAQSGQRVLLLEKHFNTGGCTHTFEAERCEWDTGLHYTSKSMGDETQRAGALMNFMTQGLQKWSMLEDPYDEVIFPKQSNTRQEASSDDDYYVHMNHHNDSSTMLREESSSQEAHEKFGSLKKSCTDSYIIVSGTDKNIDSIMNSIDPLNDQLKDRVKIYMALCDRINRGFTSLGISRILPHWLLFLVDQSVAELFVFASMTVRDVQYAVLNLNYTPEMLLSKGCPKAPTGREADPILRKLKAVLTHPIGDYAVQPRDATFAAHGVTMAHYSNGAAYTIGPTQNISTRMSSMVREFGGEVFVDATVRDIIIEKGCAVGVRVLNTSELSQYTSAATGATSDPTDKLDSPRECEESNVSVTEIRAKNIVWASGVYNLYGKALPSNMPQVKDFLNPSKRTIRQSNGHIYLFCKLRGCAQELDLPKHNLWYFNSYAIDEAFDAYFKNPRQVRPPTCYIGFPCTKDTSWNERYPNVSNCILISDGLYEWFEEWSNQPLHHRGLEYTKFKNILTKHLLDILYEMVPSVKGKVEYHTLGTPLTEVSYLSSYHGGSYGTKCLTNMFDPVNRNWTTSPKTNIPGLFLAGSDAFLPAVCGAMYGGCFGACRVLGHFGTLRLGIAFLTHFAGLLKDKFIDLTWYEAYRMALKRILGGSSK